MQQAPVWHYQGQIPSLEASMSTVPLIEYETASPEVKAVFDEIKRIRNVPDVNNL